MDGGDFPISLLQSFRSSLSVSSTTLDFGKEFATSKTPEEIALAINGFLHLHSSNKLEKFHLYFSNSENFLPYVESWLAYVAGKGVEEISLDFSMGLDQTNLYFITDEWVLHPSPTNLFECKTLTSLSLLSCDLRIPLHFSGFEFLQSLSLTEVRITADTFKLFITNSPLLDSLSITNSSCAPDTLMISSRTLRKLTIVNTSWQIYGVQIITPKLESFIYYGIHIFGHSYSDPKDSFVDVSSLSDAYICGEESHEPEHDFLKLVHDLKHVKVLTVCTYTLSCVTFRAEYVEEIPILLQNLRELQLLVGCMPSMGLECIYGFFRNCPSPFIEKLFIQLSPYPRDLMEECNMNEDVEDPSGVEFNHLKLIKMSNFKGYKGEMRLVQFLLQKAVNLESLLLVAPFKSGLQTMDAEIASLSRDDLMNLHAALCLLPKASSRSNILLFERPEDDTSLAPTHTEYFGEY